MELLDRFLNYVKVYTTSDEENDSVVPSAEREFDLARILEKELKEMGASDVQLTEHCYVYALLPATAGKENVTPIGFISHMDTAPDFSGENVKPQIIENYDGGDVFLK
ncbi:MAG: peptidase T, partial [Lachnospiraceae bacterium]|nr:peptidase T [Lachnospiraceae bacterium]